MLIELYITIFFGFVLIGNYYWYRYLREELLIKNEENWQVSLPNFALLLWVPFMLFIFIPILCQPLWHRIVSQWSNAGEWNLLSASIAAHLSVIAFALLCTRHKKLSSLLGNLSSQKKNWKESIFIGGSFLALMYPVLLLISLGWEFLLEQLNQELPEQNIVQMLSHTSSISLIIGFLFTATILAPLSEEFVFRGILFRYLKTKVSFLQAAWISGILFALIHFNIKTFPLLCLVGFFLAYSYHKSGSIRVPIIFHILFNAHSCLFILLSN